MKQLKKLDSDKLTAKQRFGILKKNNATTDFKPLFLDGQNQELELEY